MGGRKEHSRIARLKKQLEKVGFKGIGDSRDSVSSRHKSFARSGSGKTTPRDQDPASNNTRSRVRSLTLNTPTERYGGILRRPSSPINSRGGPGRGGGTVGFTALTLGSLSPQRVRSALGSSGRRLSAWTFGSAGQLNTASVAPDGTEGIA